MNHDTKGTPGMVDIIATILDPRGYIRGCFLHRMIPQITEPLVYRINLADSAGADGTPAGEGPVERPPHASFRGGFMCGGSRPLRHGLATLLLW